MEIHWSARLGQQEDTAQDAQNGCPARPQRAKRRTLRYVELLSEARTPLADFFSILLDTNILISSLITPRGTPAKVLLAWRVGHFNLVTSIPLLLELKGALSRPHLKNRYRLSSQDIHDFIVLIKDTALLIPDPGAISAQRRDPDDLAVLACA